MAVEQGFRASAFSLPNVLTTGRCLVRRILDNEEDEGGEEYDHDIMRRSNTPMHSLQPLSTNLSRIKLILTYFKFNIKFL